MAKTKPARETRALYRARAKPAAQKSIEPRATAVQTLPVASALPEQGKWTYADWVRLPDDGTRYEVIDGALFMAPPPGTGHQSASMYLSRAMSFYAEAQQLGYVYFAPVGVLLPTQTVPVQPDIVFVAAAQRTIIGPEYIAGAPALIVEILSPSNWIFDRREKFTLYQAAGVSEYWIVDYRAKTVEVFVLENGLYTLIAKWGAGETATARALAGFQIAVNDIFRDV